MNKAASRFARVRTAAASLFAASLLGMLAACGSESAQQLAPQQWQSMQVRVESRPSPLHDGTSEFLVMVDNRGKPAYNLVISLRTSDAEPWKQAIEDGQVGVYRRAIKVEPGAELQVQIRSKDAEGVLRFPLKTRP